MSDLMNLSNIDQNMRNNLMETNFEIPQNIDAEQALLGALLVNNEIYDKINNILKTEHFYDPVHQKIYEICAEKISRNSLASPVTLKTYFQDDPGIKELGGIAYLAKLAASAISIYASTDHAHLISELALRRSLINLGREISEKAAIMTIEENAEEQISSAELKLYNIADKGNETTGFTHLVSASREAIDIANNQETISTSLLQRRLRIGYPRAARIMDTLEEQGIVDAGDGSNARKVISHPDTQQEDHSNDDENASKNSISDPIQNNSLDFPKPFDQD